MHYRLIIRQIIVLLIVGCAGMNQARAALPGTVSLQYEVDQKYTVVFSHEKLVDGTTSIQMGYGYPGHVLKTVPTRVSLTLFGYHDTAEWQSLDSLTVSFDGDTYTGKPLHTIHGDDRDKSMDLVEAKYFESLILEMPYAIAKRIAYSKSVEIQSTPSTVDLTVSQENMDRCRDDLETIPTIMSAKPLPIPDLSKNGLPVVKTIDSDRGDVKLTTGAVKISDNLYMMGLLFTRMNGQPCKPPFFALCLIETDDIPLLKDQSGLGLRYSDTRLELNANAGSGGQDDLGYTEWVRTYPVTFNQFHRLTKANGFMINVGNMSYWVGKAQMSGLVKLMVSDSK